MTRTQQCLPFVRKGLGQRKLAAAVVRWGQLGFQDEQWLSRDVFAEVQVGVG